MELIATGYFQSKSIAGLKKGVDLYMEHKNIQSYTSKYFLKINKWFGRDINSHASGLEATSNYWELGGNFP